MLDDYSHLKYHEFRQRDLILRAKEDRLLTRRQWEKRELRRAERRQVLITLFLAAKKARAAARTARRDAWLDEMETLQHRSRTVRIA